MSELFQARHLAFDCGGTLSLISPSKPRYRAFAQVMFRTGQDEIRADLPRYLTRLWRYGLVLSGRRDTAEDLVQSTCLRALERAEQFSAGTNLQRWLFSIMHSIWLNEVRSRRIREGSGTVDAEAALAFDGSEQVEASVLAHQVLREVLSLPDGQREAVFLVYGEGMAYREAAEVLAVPIGTIMSRLAAARLTLGRLGTEARTS
ncbi:sigma-70 family RNA polymerase sigma factor [Microvirga sp. TS319]|uniref:sigma-70 family RNA polymerase sigma factor n=1 Tax=Microvirga sp. TS319 TaxID=3241165 RepID=UPI00351A4E14